MVTTSKAEETRERIVDAALRLFREKGFDETTMRDVAAAAELLHDVVRRDPRLFVDEKDAVDSRRVRLHRRVTIPQSTTSWSSFTIRFRTGPTSGSDER